MDLEKYIADHVAWSAPTFGDGRHTQSLVAHIQKELFEILIAPTDAMEWVDVIILAIDGATRAGHSPGEVCRALEKKQKINMARKWVFKGKDLPVEHDRSQDA